VDPPPADTRPPGEPQPPRDPDVPRSDWGDHLVPPVPALPPMDIRVPDLSVPVAPGTGAQPLRLSLRAVPVGARRIEVYAGCNVACDLRLGGTIRMGHRRLRLQRSRAHLSQAGSLSVTLGLRRGVSGLKRARAAKHRVVSIWATGRDSAGAVARARTRLRG
jgi:hypothetical protein